MRWRFMVFAVLAAVPSFAVTCDAQGSRSADGEGSTIAGSPDPPMCDSPYWAGARACDGATRMCDSVACWWAAPPVAIVVGHDSPTHGAMCETNDGRCRWVKKPPVYYPDSQRYRWCMSATGLYEICPDSKPCTEDPERCTPPAIGELRFCPSGAVCRWTDGDSTSGRVLCTETQKACGCTWDRAIVDAATDPPRAVVTDCTCLIAAQTCVELHRIADVLEQAQHLGEVLTR